MNKLILKSVLALFLSETFAEDVTEYRHKIEPFSFDIQRFEYPLEYLKMGTTVALKDTIKVIPMVENRYGGIFMS
jgi:hypothetical protein